MADLKTITDTVHGTIRLDPLTLDLLETLELQRLNSIRQLGLTYLVFPGANHSRVEHCLGVGHVGGDGARTRPAGRRTKARPGGGPSPRRRARSVLPYLGARPKPRARGGPHAPDAADHHGPRRQRVPGRSARLPGRQADSRSARSARGESRGRRRPNPRAFGEGRWPARARRPEGVETVPRADHP